MIFQDSVYSNTFSIKVCLLCCLNHFELRHITQGFILGPLTVLILVLVFLSNLLFSLQVLLVALLVVVFTTQQALAAPDPRALPDPRAIPDPRAAPQYVYPYYGGYYYPYVYYG